MKRPVELIKESLAIEGIHRSPTLEELAEYDRFMTLPEVTVLDLERFVSVYEPGAVLRSIRGLNVSIGGRLAPVGGPGIPRRLQTLLDESNRNQGAGRDCPGAFELHVEYEALHPFTDCNGRSGRMLWFWLMRDMPLGFLHHFYYQALGHLARQGE